MLDACIVDQNIGAAERLDAVGDQPATVVALRHIGCDIDHARAMFFAQHAGKGMIFVAVGEGIDHNVVSAAANAWAMPRPIPELEPVTIAVLRAVASVMGGRPRL